MSVVVVIKLRGDADKMLQAYDEVMRHPMAIDQATRTLQHAARTDYGLLIVDVWDNREDFIAENRSAELGAIFDRLNITEQEQEIWKSIAQ